MVKLDFSKLEVALSIQMHACAYVFNSIYKNMGRV